MTNWYGYIGLTFTRDQAARLVRDLVRELGESGDEFDARIVISPDYMMKDTTARFDIGAFSGFGSGIRITDYDVQAAPSGEEISARHESK